MALSAARRRLMGWAGESSRCEDPAPTGGACASIAGRIESRRALYRAAARRVATNACARRHANSQSQDPQSHSGSAPRPARRPQRCLSVGFRPRRAREIRFGVARAPANPRNRIFIPRASAPSPRGLKPPSRTGKPLCINRRRAFVAAWRAAPRWRIAQMRARGGIRPVAVRKRRATP